MTVLVLFRCGGCGYGPFEVEDNADAPIPDPPISIHHDDAEGRPLAECPNCEDPLPDFSRARRRR